MPEEEDVPALGVGHRGANRRVRRAPAVVAAEEEPRAPEVIRLDDSEDEEKEDKKLPAIGVGWLGAPTPVEAPATRRRAATSKAEARDVTEEAVHTRATRQHKPTMKAAAAAVEKALPKARRRKAVKKTSSQQDEQEKPLGECRMDLPGPPPWAHYLGGYQDRLLGGPLGLLGLCHTAPDGVGRKDYGGGVLE
jgi:hypothetical protein